MKSFIHSLYQTLFSKTLPSPGHQGRPGWLDGLSLSAFLQKAYGKSTRKKNIHSGSPLASLGLHLPQVELLESRITPATLPSSSLLSQDHSLVIVTQDLVDRVPQQELANACVVTLDPAKDAIHQISTELANRSGLETLRIITHGEAGVLHFGNQVVDQGVLAARGEEIATWANSLAPGADLLLYGCAVAQSEVGQNFVITLSELTRADVAASIDATGAGGNTALEFAAGGAVDAGLRASAQEWEAAHLQLTSPADFTYLIQGDVVMVTGYSGPGGAVTLPFMFSSYLVTEIAPWAFSGGTSITSVTIPSTYTRICYDAFSGCTGLTSVTIPNSVTYIGANVFSGCTSLTSVTIPNSVPAIRFNAFSGCTSLTSVTIGTSVTSIEYNAFSGCSGLTSITIPDSVTAIGSSAFSGCSGLTSITIPNSVTSLGDNAFQGCTSLAFATISKSVTAIADNMFSGCTSLTSVTIPDSVTAIGINVFSGCTSLTDFYVHANNPSFSSVDGILYNKAQTTLIQCPMGKTGAITIPNSVTNIGGNAFSGCSSLTNIAVHPDNPSFSSVDGILYNKAQTTLIQCPMGKTGAVTIPNSVTSIDNSMFSGRIGLTSVTIPDSVTSIGANAFYGCTSLASVFIGYSVTSIGANAFYGCTSLTSIYFMGNAPALGATVFNAVPGTVNYLQGKTGWTNPFGGRPAIAYNSFGLIFAFNNGAITITGYPGGGSAATIPTTIFGLPVTAIGNNAFLNKTSLTSVTIPNSVTSIGDNAFTGCTSLNSAYFLGNAPSLSSSVFTNVPGTVYYLSGTSGWTNPFASLPTVSVNFNSNGLIFAVNNGAITITGYNGTGGTVTIPATIFGLPVTAIGDNAFENKTTITSITIPNSLTSIGINVFYGCSGLTAISVDAANPNFSSADGLLYNKTQTTLIQCPKGKAGAVTIPNSVTSIGNPMFSGRTGLTAFVVHPDNPSFSSADGLLYNKTQTTLIQCPEGKAGAVTIPNSVTSIGDNAFSGCTSITSITIPNSVTSIGDNAFTSCTSLASIYFLGNAPALGTTVFNAVPGTVYYLSGTSGWTNPFGGLPTVVVYFNFNGFNFALINSAITITGYTGVGGAVNIPATIFGLPVTAISNNAFQNKTSLTSVTIPNSVTAIGDYAFYGCTGLTSVTIPNSITAIGDAVFFGCTGLTSVTIPNSVIPIGNFAFKGCIGLTSVTIPNSVTAIGDHAFYGCIGLTSVTIPNSVTSIGDYAFYGCTGLTSVTIPNSVTAIGDYAFYGCTGLNSVTISNSLTTISDSAFRSCIGLTSVTIPNSVTAIGAYAFEGCTRLTSTYFLGNAPSLGGAAFDGVLGMVYYLSGATGWGSSFGDRPVVAVNFNSNGFNFAVNNGAITITGYTGAGGAITIPATIFGLPVTAIGNNAFKNKNTITSVTIPNSVTSIGNNAFQFCTGLTSVTIPISVTSIGDFAFYYCTGLTSITIPNSVTAIGMYAFYYSTGLTSIYFLGNAPALGSAAFDYVPGTVYYLSGTTGWGSSFGGRPAVTVNFNSNGFNFAVNNEAITITGYTGAGGPVTIPATIFGLPVTAFLNNPFQNKSTITTITIPNSVTVIGNNEFEGCTSLTSIYFLGNAPSLGSGVFNAVPGTVYYLSGTSGWSNPFGGRPSQVFTLFPTNIFLSSVTIPENNLIGTTVATLTSASVVLGDGFTYTLVAGPGSGNNAAFTIDGASLKLALVPDFETKSSYSVRIRSADASNVAYEKQFTISVTDVNDAPVITSGSTGTVAENAVASTVIYTATATDVDAGAIIAYSIKPSVGDAGLVSIHASTGVVTLNTSANFEAKPSYTFTVVVSDNWGLKAEKSVTFSVTDVNEVPVVTSGNTGTVAENAAPATVIYTATATDVDANAIIAYSIKPLVADASLVAIEAATGAVTLITPANFEVKPSYTFTVVATDNGSPGLFDEKSVTISVPDLNEAPVFTSGSTGAVAENTTTAMVIYTATTTDVDASATVTFSIKPSVGDAGLVSIDASTGAVTLNASANFEAKPSYTFTVVATDNGTPGLTAEKSVTVSVTDVNEAPVITSGSTGAVAENAATATVIYTASATDVDANAIIAYSIKPSVGDAGLISINASTGAVTLITSANFEAKPSFTFTVVATDNGSPGLTAEKSVTVTVTDVNDAPIASTQTINLTEDTFFIGTLNGSDIENSTLTYSVVSQGTKGTVVITNTETGAFTYTPNANATGADSFTFKVNDGTADSAAATVTVNINAVNDAPVANPQTIIATEDTPFIGTLAGSDIENSTLTYSVVSQGTKGTVVITNTVTGAFTYTPNANATGADSFSFRVNDGALDSAAAMVTVNINAVNDAPVANPQTINLIEDTPFLGTLTGSDIEGSTLTYSVVSQGTKGTVVITNTETGAFNYTPNANATGADSFTFKVNDGTVDSAAATVTVNITAVNDAPVASPQTINLTEDTLFLGTLAGSDIENSTLTYSVVSQGTKGTVVITNTVTGAFTYTPNAHANGTDSFTFKVNDGSLNSVAAVVTVNITAANDIPTANAQTINLTEDTLYIGTLTGSDIEGSALTYSVVSQGTKGTVVITNTETGAFTYTPNANATGADSFTFKVNDGTANSPAATVTVNITAVNDAPVANAQTITPTEDTLFIGTLTGSDIEGSTLTYSVVSQGTKGTVVITNTETGAFTYTPHANAIGADSFSFKVNDGSLNSVAAVVTVNITAANDIPTANAQTINLTEDTLYIGTLTGSDIEGSTLTYSVVSQGTKGTVVITNTETGAFTYTPNAHATDADSFTFKVNDGTVDSPAATVTVNITAVNDAPVANAQTINPTEDTLFIGTLAGSDIENSTLTYSVVSQRTKGTVVITNTETGAFTYTPHANAIGADSFSFKVNDGSLNSVAALVTVNINAVNDVPINEAIPQISGPTRMAGVLTASTGTWSDAADGNPGFDFSYQWFRLKDEPGASAELISGVNGSEYTIQTPDLGKYLRVQVTAADRGNPGSISVSALSTILRIPGVKPLATGSGALVSGAKQGDSPTPTTPMNPFPGFTGEVHMSSLEVNGEKGELQDTELVIGAGKGGGPHVKVMSMKTGKENGSFMAYDAAFRGGVFISVGDVTGDGLADIVTSTGPGGGPHVKVFDRATMTEVVSFFAYAAEFRSGVTVAVVDVDLDGVGEIVTGAGQGGGPHVKVFKISAGAIVVQNEFFAFDPELRNGIHVSGGDIDGDGRVELVVGLGEGVGPLVGVYDANSTRQIDLFFAYSQDFTGGTRVSVSDGEGDGIADLITGAGPGGAAHVKVFKNIRSGRILAREFIAQPGSNGAVLSI